MDLWKNSLATGGCGCWLSWSNGCWEWRPLGMAALNPALAFTPRSSTRTSFSAYDAPESRARLWPSSPKSVKSIQWDVDQHTYRNSIKEKCMRALYNTLFRIQKTLIITLNVSNIWLVKLSACVNDLLPLRKKWKTLIKTKKTQGRISLKLSEISDFFTEKFYFFSKNPNFSPKSYLLSFIRQNFWWPLF